MKHLTHKRFQIPAILFIIDCLVFGTTDPHNVPSFALIIAFLLLATSVYYFWKSVIWATQWYGLKFSRPARLTVVLSAVVSGLIALQSIGELTSRDILVLLPFVIVSYLYFSYGQTKRSPTQSYQ